MAYSGARPLPVSNGGTGLSTLTAHAIQVGNGTSAPTQLAVGATGTVLSGSTGADPAFTATPSVTSITLSGGSALSAYATGTWTPAIAFGGGTTGITYGTRFGGYVRIGSLCFVTFTITLTNKGSSVGNAALTDLPFASQNNAISGFIYITTANMTFTANYTDCYGTTANSTQIDLAQTGALAGGATSGVASLADTNFTNTTVLVGEMCYLC